MERTYIEEPPKKKKRLRKSFTKFSETDKSLNDRVTMKSETLEASLVQPPVKIIVKDPMKSTTPRQSSSSQNQWFVAFEKYNRV